MTHIIYYIVLIIGFVMLIKGADVFVDGASNMAVCLKVPTLIIGLTIVAFGTSAPETAVSIAAAVSGSNDLAIGNVVGSNIFNLLVVAGISAMIAPVAIDRSVKKRDVPATVFFSAVFVLLSFCFLTLDGVKFGLTRTEGAILLGLLILYTIILIRSALKERAPQNDELVIGKFDSRFFLKNLLFLLVGMAVVALGGKAVVYAATILAEDWGWSERVIGITIVALGTSLPELCTSCCAMVKGESDMALGNVLGSNIMNIGVVIGLSAMITPMTVDTAIWSDMLFMLLSIVAFGLYTFFFKKVGKIAGFVMVAAYVLYTIHLIMG